MAFRSTTACLTVLTYLVISPVKDEERYIEHALESMAAQTIKPVRWIIVDDGSTDRTAEIVTRHQKDSAFIDLVQIPPGQPRHPGAGIIRAFNRGYEAAQGVAHDLVVKLDCDLSFPPDYFEKLIAAFDADPKLGIASGLYQEQHHEGQWIDVPMPFYHAAGASKVVRRECFEQIGGFISARGWDTVDELRAMTSGWRTCHFPELKMQHWKLEGSSIGWLRTRMMHGSVFYLTGGSRLFFLLKVVRCMASRPVLLAGLAMLWGYLDAAVRRRPRLVSPAELRCYRALLNRRIVDKSRYILRSENSITE